MQTEEINNFFPWIFFTIHYLFKIYLSKIQKNTKRNEAF